MNYSTLSKTCEISNSCVTSNKKFFPETAPVYNSGFTIMTKYPGTSGEAIQRTQSPDMKDFEYHTMLPGSGCGCGSK